MRALVGAVEMVFGSAAALSSTFGYRDRVGLDVQLLRDVQKEILSLCEKRYANNLQTVFSVVFLLCNSC